MDPAALAWAQSQPQGSDAQKLAAAIVAGARSVRFADGREVQYQDPVDLWRALTALQSAATPAASRRPPMTLARFRRGSA